MAVIALQVQRQVEGLDQRILKLPRPRMRHPTHERVVRHPLRQPCLPIRERQPPAAADPTQHQAELLGKQAAKREPQRRPVGVEGIVLAQPSPEVLAAGATPLAGGAFGEMPTYSRVRPAQELQLVVSMAAGSCLKYQA
jgi:hypothetical protein